MYLFDSLLIQNTSSSDMAGSPPTKWLWFRIHQSFCNAFITIFHPTRVKLFSYLDVDSVSTVAIFSTRKCCLSFLFFFFFVISYSYVNPLANFDMLFLLVFGSLKVIFVDKNYVFNSFITEVLIIQKPVRWLAVQVNGLVFIW